mgnify:CR=1 FL=1
MVCRFQLLLLRAVIRNFINRQGEREADVINCVVWRKQAENVANYLRKGSLAGVDGRIQTRSYEAQDGRRVYVTEVVCDSVQFLEPRSVTERRHEQFGSSGFQQVGDPFGSENQNQPRTPDFAQNEDPFFDDSEPIDISDDDLPF